jgi:Putative phage holin Dp-1
MVSRHYDLLKVLAQIWIPGIATLYFTLAQIWGIPYATEVVGSLTAVDTFLGVILRISTDKYVPPSDGQLLIDHSDPEKGKLVFNLETSLDEIPDKDHVRLKVYPVTDLGNSQG